MKYYLAPLEGVTTLIYRNAFAKYFKGVDKLYIPFISPTVSRSLTNKEAREMSPLNNKLTYSRLIPQIISKNAQDSLFLINEAKRLGYKEVNLNLGCPSPTVTSKGKGSGLLKDLIILDNYLNEIFSNVEGIDISIKTRIGFDSVDEFLPILNIYNKYPISELVIHPRLAKEKYLGVPHLEIMDDLNKLTNIPLIYNGDIKSNKDIEYIKTRFPYLKGIMLGRGLLERPYLLQDDNADLKEDIKSFFLEILDNSIKEFNWGHAKYFAKEIWAFLQHSFIIPSNIAKKPFKQEKSDEFKKLVLEIIDNYPLNFEDELSYSFKK